MVRAKEKIRLCLPIVGKSELSEIAEVLASGYLTQGSKTQEFEEMVAAYVGTKYAFSTTSATTALHLSLAALDIKRGDEVLVPDFTFPATANVVIQQGAMPILVDIDLDTFNMNIEDMTKKITPRTKAIIPVHLFGLSADMDPILSVAEKRGIFVVEDAACALGALYKNRMCGSIGDAGCFSFHPRKVITTGEGGMITTNNGKLAKKIIMLRNHGGERKAGRFTFREAGFNYRLSDINCAMGIAQMRKLNKLIKDRKELATCLKKRLSCLSGISCLPDNHYGADHIYQSFVILLDSGRLREKIIKELAQDNIESTLGTYALHAQPYMKKFGYKAGDLPNSYLAYSRALTLPFYPGMPDRAVSRIERALVRYCGNVVNTVKDSRKSQARNVTGIDAKS